MTNADAVSGTMYPETIGDAVAMAHRRLAAVGILSARLDARLLVGDAIDRDAAFVFGHGEETLGEDAAIVLDGLIARRAGHEPMAHILGFREFWSLDFHTGPGALVPRPDSETLIEAVLEHFTDKGAPLSVLDLGTGTGCLLLSVLSEYPQATGLGIDIEEGALSLARQNAATLGFSERSRFFQSNWTDGVDGTFDVILCNPPYIPDGEFDALMPEVLRFDPRRALAGGSDGLQCYRVVADGLGRILAPYGKAFVELGIGQEKSVGNVFTAAGLQAVEIKKDLSGISRCLVVCKRISPIRKKGLE